jgi:ABC-type lipoprotein release transport system permease subunit
MRSMLVGVRPEDPVTFAAMAAIFAVIACAACWLPARRAARLDPTAALRDE